MTLKYRKLSSYKFEVVEDCSVQTDILCACRIVDDEGQPLITLTQDGLLTAHAGYAWDGVSFHPLNVMTSMLRPSLFHDCGAQLIREGKLDDEAKDEVDRLFYDLCKENGVNPALAWIAYQTVHHLHFFVNRDKEKEDNEQTMVAL